MAKAITYRLTYLAAARMAKAITYRLTYLTAARMAKAITYRLTYLTAARMAKAITYRLTYLWISSQAGDDLMLSMTDKVNSCNQAVARDRRAEACIQSQGRDVVQILLLQQQSVPDLSPKR